MNEYKIKLFHFEELSEYAKSHVCDKERKNPYNWGTLSQETDAEERYDSLKGFCKAMDLWFEIDWDHSTRFIKWGFQYDNEMKNKDGKYLLRYLNSHYFDIRTKKYYSTKGHYDENGRYQYKYRYSRFQYIEGNCPFTGICYDDDLLKPIFDWYRNPNWRWDIEDMIEECFSYFLQCWEKDDEYRMSDENISDMILANWGDKLYYEDGTEFTGDESMLIAA